MARISGVSGPVLTAEDPGYVTETAGFNTAAAHTPDVVVGIESVEDAVAVVRHAQTRGQRIAIQATGHGNTAVTSGVLVTTRRLHNLDVDVETRLATIGAGLRWGDVLQLATKDGLFPVSGSSPNVGVVGYLLGGGLGPLARSHGFSSDYLMGATVVTGTGEVVRATASESPDLLWALRGGKYGLGLVVDATVRLVELRALYGGSLTFDEPDIETALRAWVDWTPETDPRVTTSVAILRLPPLEFIPEPLRGRRVLNVRFAFPGAAAEGEQLAAPLRAAAPVYLDALSEMPADEVGQIHNDPTQPGPSWVDGKLLRAIDQDFVTALLSSAAAGPQSPFVGVELRQLGAATEVDVEGGSAASGRGAAFTFAVIAVDPATFATAAPDAAREVTRAVQGWVSSEKNINFSGDPRALASTAWSPDVMARLADVRRRYDPDGLFAP